MADLTFHHGPMGAGKSMHALVAAHQQTRRGRRVLVCVTHSRVEGTVQSRVGIAAPATHIQPDTDLYDTFTQAHRTERLAAAVIDEAQFLTVDQVDQVAAFVDAADVAVDCYGLLTDFRGRLFPGSARLVEQADSLCRITPGPSCWCGDPATHTVRIVNGRAVMTGDVVVVGDIGGTAAVSYDALCRPHHRTGQIDPEPPPAIQAA